MSAPVLTDEQVIRAAVVVAGIGRAIRGAREAHRETQDEVAAALRMRQSTISYVERGWHHNLKVGTAVKLLDRYGLTLAVQAKAP